MNEVIVTVEHRAHKPGRYHKRDPWSKELATRCGVYHGKGDAVGKLERVTVEEAESRGRLPCLRCFEL